MISGYEGSKARQVLITEADLPRVLEALNEPAGTAVEEARLGLRLALRVTSLPSRQNTAPCPLSGRPSARRACASASISQTWRPARRSGRSTCGRSRTRSSGCCPGSTFVRTFLRTYAEVLGLDPNRLVEEYRTNYEPRDELDVQPIAPGSGGGGRRERPARAPGPYRHGTRSPLWRSRPRPPDLPSCPRAHRRRRQRGRRPVGADRHRAHHHGEAEEEAARHPDERDPRVEPDGPTYICVDKGPGTEPDFEGTISEPQTFKGGKLRINLGRTGAARAERPELPRRAERHPCRLRVQPHGQQADTAGSVPASRERPRRDRRDGHRGAHRAGPRPQRPLAVRPPGGARRRARPHHDLRRPPRGHRGAAPLPERSGCGPDRDERRPRAHRRRHDDRGGGGVQRPAAVPRRGPGAADRGDPQAADEALPRPRLRGRPQVEREAGGGARGRT